MLTTVLLLFVLHCLSGYGMSRHQLYGSYGCWVGNGNNSWSSIYSFILARILMYVYGRVTAGGGLRETVSISLHLWACISSAAVDGTQRCKGTGDDYGTTTHVVPCEELCRRRRQSSNNGHCE